MVRLGALVVAEPLPDGGQHLPRDARHVLDQGRELARVQHQNSSCRSRPSPSPSAGAEPISAISPKPSPGPSFLPFDRGIVAFAVPRLDHEAPCADLALPHQHLAGRDLDLDGERGDLGQFALRCRPRTALPPSSRWIFGSRASRRIACLVAEYFSRGADVRSRDDSVDARDGARRAGGAAARGGAPRARARARPGCSSGCAPAASAAPTCTSSTASSPSRSCRWCPATRSSARSSAPGGRRALRARRSGRHPVAGLDLRRVPLLPLGPREPLRARASPAMSSTAATPSSRSPTSASAFRCRPTPAIETAPLLCAGLIGYRALRMCGDAERLGLYGFGASAHIVCPGRRPPGAAGVRGHPRADARSRSSRASSAPSGPGVRRRAPGGARRGDRLRPGRRVGSGRARGAGAGRRRRLRRHPHERHPRRFPTSRSGASARSARSPT